MPSTFEIKISTDIPDWYTLPQHWYTLLLNQASSLLKKHFSLQNRSFMAIYDKIWLLSCYLRASGGFWRSFGTWSIEIWLKKRKNCCQNGGGLDVGCLLRQKPCIWSRTGEERSKIDEECLVSSIGETCAGAIEEHVKKGPFPFTKENYQKIGGSDQIQWKREELTVGRWIARRQIQWPKPNCNIAYWGI